jgi:signal transduction histidine kinase
MYFSILIWRDSLTQPSALEQAKKSLDALVEQAKSGAIIPDRLAGQLEELAALLKNVGEEHAAALTAVQTKPAEAASGFDKDQFMTEQAGFFGHAIHELRTPMTSIRGYSDMMANPAMGVLSDMHKQFSDVIRTNAKRMEGLLTDVSDMNKLRAGTLRTNIKMDMFKNIAMMVEKNVEPLTEQLNRTFKLEIPSGLPILNTDGELFAKALTKLVENGLRYTQDKGTVTMRASAKDGELIVIVEDDGIGMPAEEIQQLGTVYFRSDNEYVRSYKGSGLGIPVAYGLIKLLGGQISVESEKDKGTKFTVTLAGMS